MKNTNDAFKKNRNAYLRRSILSIEVLLIGAVALCGLLSLMQTRATETLQQQRSEKILEEVENTLTVNDLTINSAIYEFNETNQSTLSILSDYIEDVDVLQPLEEATTPEEAQELILDACGSFKKICDNVGVSNIFLIQDDGQTIISSAISSLNINWRDVTTPDVFNNLTAHSETQNGTEKITEKGDKEYVPMISPYESVSYYTYSTFFMSYNEHSYFLLTNISDGILTAELSGIKDISSVLSGVSIGKSGFLFAVDSQTEEFIYFNDGNETLSGEKYSKYGMSEEAAKNNYVGYQTIAGVDYYLVAKSFESESYGKFTVLAAVLSVQEMLVANVSVIALSCLAFVLVSCIIVAYGMVLKRDVADHVISLEDKLSTNYKDQNKNGKTKYTDEEIAERVQIQVSEEIEKGEDKKLRRSLIGTRDLSGAQHYFSKYIFNRMLPVTIIGLAAIFLISFFSQTLLGLNDVTSVSSTRLNDIQTVLETNEKNTKNIQEYIDTQYLSKTVIFSYIFEEEPHKIFNQDAENENVHPLYARDKDDNKNYLVDQYGNQRYATSKVKALDDLCTDNDIAYIYVYDEDGYVIATNSASWYQHIDNGADNILSPFRAIIDQRTDQYIQQSIVNVDGRSFKNIGYKYFYYTYQSAGGETIYTNKASYEKYLEGTWTEGPITKHRSLVQISVDESTLQTLYEVTSLSYVLSNMHVYGEQSFFVAFDTTDDHKIVYSPVASSIGKKAADVGMSESAFKIGSTYNGFQKINGVTYYESVKQIGDYYICAATPNSSIYQARNAISSYTLLFSFLFIVVASGFYTLSTDKQDAAYIAVIKHRDGADIDAKKNAITLTTPTGQRKKTTSAISRYYKTTWRYKTAEQKLSTILFGYTTAAAIFVLVSILISVTRPKSDNIFTYIFSGQWDRGFNVFAITQSLMIIILIFVVTKLIQVAVKSFCSVLGSRVETTGNLVVSVLRYGGIIGGLFYCLYLFGLNTASLLTSAGILSIVIGLGAQSLISDIIAGVFIVFEGEFRVGDIVTIGDFRGQVVEIGLRTTKIVDVSNNIKIFNNSSISGVLNMTKESSYASIDVGIEYGESLERVENVLSEAFPEIKKKLPAIIDGPFYKGVVELGDSSVNIRILATCKEQDRIQLSRDLNREIFLLFNKNNINIPFPQITLSYLKENDNVELSRKEKNNAEEFVNTQKEVRIGDVEDDD